MYKSGFKAIRWNPVKIKGAVILQEFVKEGTELLLCYSDLYSLPHRNYWTFLSRELQWWINELSWSVLFDVLFHALLWQRFLAQQVCKTNIKYFLFLRLYCYLLFAAAVNHQI